MQKKITKHNIKRIAIFRTDRLGEVLLSTVCISPVKKYFNPDYLCFVTSGYSKDVVLARHEIDDVYCFSTFKKPIGFLNIIKFIFFLKSKKLDLVLILNPHKILNLCAFFAGINIRIGYDRKWPFLLTCKIKDEKFFSKKHEIEYNLDFLKSAGISADQFIFEMPSQRKDIEYVEAVLDDYKISSSKSIVCIHAFSSNQQKVWDLRNYKKLIERMSSAGDIIIALIGEKNQEKQADKLISQLDTAKIINLCGKFTVGQLGAFLKNCRLFIGNDSGPMHIAAACGISVIALFGKASDYKRWMPWGQKHIVLHKDNIDDIIPDEVLTAMENVLCRRF